MLEKAMQKILIMSVLSLALSLGCAQVFAQSQSIDVLKDVVNAGDGSAVDGNAPHDTNKWRILAGAGAAVFPTFSGSEDYRGGLAPFVHASYGRFFVGTGGLGVDLLRDRTWRVNVHLTGNRGRKESDDSHLNGLGDIDSTLRGGVTARYSLGRFAVSAQVFSDILGRDQGTLARVDAFARFMPTQRLVVIAGPGVTWANNRYSQTYFGVNAIQHANSGLAQFDANGGLNSVRFSVNGIYVFNRHWIGLANASVSQLQDDAARSPIVESRSQNALLVAVAYSF
jgi:outer membrane protein